MCGIFGFQVKPGKVLTEYEATVLSLVLAGEMENRGKDSFGAVSFPMPGDDNRVASILRGVGKITSNGSKLFKLASQSRSFLAHTRAATVGAVCTNNCHPFKQGDVLGVHNGSIFNYKDMNQKYDRSLQVDSMQMFAHLNEGLPLDELEGYGTFFWSRANEDWAKIYLAKTLNGSLSVAKFYRKNDEDDKRIEADEHFLTVWASEIFGISKVAYLLDVNYTSVVIASEEIYSISNAEISQENIPFKLSYPMDKGKKWNNCYIVGKGKDKEETEEGCSASPKHNLSRKERKRLRKLEKARKESSVDWARDPSAENIFKGYGLQKVYIPIDGKSGEAVAHYLCPECECPLRDHIWGWCQNKSSKNESTCCKSPTGYGCEPDIPICVDCGHYLVIGIHEADIVQDVDVVECKECNNFCISELTNFKKYQMIRDAQQEADDTTQPQEKKEPALILLP